MGGTSFDRPLTMESILNAIYPVGSIYTSVQSTSPATLFGGTWVQIKGSFLYACEDSGITAGGTGGAKSVSYTPAGSNSGGSVGSHTLTTSEIPSHSHGLNSHTHSVGAHSHGLNSHKHSVGAHSHGLNSHKHSVGAHSHGLNSHKHSYIKYTSCDNATINFSNGAACVNGSATAAYTWLYISHKTAPATVSSTWAYRTGAWTAADNINNSARTQLAGSQAHKHGWGVSTVNGDAATGSTANSTAFDSGAASGSTANSTAFDSGAASGSTANSTAFDTGAASGSTASSGSGGGHNHGFTNPTFTGTAATIATMPPYLAVYMWKRTA